MELFQVERISIDEGQLQESLIELSEWAKTENEFHQGQVGT